MQTVRISGDALMIMIILSLIGLGTIVGFIGDAVRSLLGRFRGDSRERR